MHDTALANAVLLCDEPAVEAILGRDRSLALTTDDEGQTLVMTAVSSGNEANGVSLPILARLLDAGVDINAQDHEGRTALALALGECGLEVVQFLLDRGANPNLGNPLIWGLWHSETNSDELAALLDAGADPRAQAMDGMNALEWAEENGDDEVIDLLKRASRRTRKT